MDESASLIERQQKAIDLLLIALEPFAVMSNVLDPITPDRFVAMCTNFRNLENAEITYGDLRAARSAKEQVVRILNQREDE